MANLKTKRSSLRRFRISDLKNMIELETDPDIMKFTPSVYPRPVDQIQQRLENMMAKEKDQAPLGVWAAETIDTHDFIGWFMILKTRFPEPELGFMIVKRQWGHGYATEVAQALIDYAFQTLEYDKLKAVTTPDNTASQRVLTKLGFKKTGSMTTQNAILQKEQQLDVFEISK